jgi:hypothetical protein
MPSVLEGSRFPSWQLCGFAAGGSRKLPNAFALIQRLARIVPIKSTNVTNDGKSWAVSGSRLLQTDRAASLESGSPPGLRRMALRCSLGGRERSVLALSAIY